MGANQLVLWVLDGNHDALRAYEALGFRPIGEPQFLRAFGRWEQRLGVHVSCLTQPMRTAGSLSLDHGPSLQPQEIHGLQGAADVVYGVENFCQSARSSRQALMKCTQRSAVILSS